MNRVFRLDSQNGRLCLGQKVDFERRSRYQLTILAKRKGLSKQSLLNITFSDSKISSALVDVHIDDVNDHAPQFHPQEYFINLRESQSYIGPILNVYATDEDRKDYETLQYFIEETNNDVAKFRLNEGLFLCLIYFFSHLYWSQRVLCGWSQK